MSVLKRKKACSTPTTVDQNIRVWAVGILEGDVLGKIEDSLKKFSTDYNLTEEEVLVAAACFRKQGSQVVNTLIAVVALFVAAASLTWAVWNQPVSEGVAMLMTITLIVFVPAACIIAFGHMRQSGIPDAVEGIIRLRSDRGSLSRI